MVSLVKQVVTPFCSILVELAPLEKLKHIYPLRKCFQRKEQKNMSLEKRIFHFFPKELKNSGNFKNIEEIQYFIDGHRSKKNFHQSAALK